MERRRNSQFIEWEYPSQAIYIEPLDAHLFFLTTYANTAGELLRFKLYDDETGTVHNLSETMYFSPDLHQGSIENPVPFEWLTTGTETSLEDARVFEVQPNPFSRETTLRFVLPKAEEVTLTISDAQGREVLRRPVSAEHDDLERALGCGFVVEFGGVSGAVADGGGECE